MLCFQVECKKVYPAAQDTSHTCHDSSRHTFGWETNSFGGEDTHSFCFLTYFLFSAWLKALPACTGWKADKHPEKVMNLHTPVDSWRKQEDNANSAQSAFFLLWSGRANHWATVLPNTQTACSNRKRALWMICASVCIIGQIWDLGDDAKFSNQAVIQLHTELSR